MQRHIHHFCSSLRRIDDGLVVAQFAQRLVAQRAVVEDGEFPAVHLAHIALTILFAHKALHRFCWEGHKHSFAILIALG